MLILGCPRIEANEFKVLATLELFGAVLGTEGFEAEDSEGLELFGAEELFNKEVPAAAEEIGPPT